MRWKRAGRLEWQTGRVRERVRVPGRSTHAACLVLPVHAPFRRLSAVPRPPGHLPARHHRSHGPCPAPCCGAPPGCPPEWLDVDREAGDGVCQGCIQGVVGLPLKQRLQPVLPAVKGLRGWNVGRRGRRQGGRAGMRAGREKAASREETANCQGTSGCGRCPMWQQSALAALAALPATGVPTAGVMREALGPSTSSSVRLHNNKAESSIAASAAAVGRQLKRQAGRGGPNWDALRNFGAASGSQSGQLHAGSPPAHLHHT